MLVAAVHAACGVLRQAAPATGAILVQHALSTLWANMRACIRKPADTATAARHVPSHVFIRHLQHLRRPPRHVLAGGIKPGAGDGAAEGLIQPNRRQLLSVGLPMACSCCMSNPQQPAGWYDSFLAYSLNNFMGRYEDTVAPLKALLFQLLLQGRLEGSAGTAAAAAAAAAATAEGQAGAQRTPLSILEIGIGTGPNIPYYLSNLPPEQHKQLQLTGLDPNPAMQQYAQQNAAAAGLEPDQLRLLLGDAKQLPFEDGSFDAAVITLVLCTAKEPVSVLREVKRVLRPGGKLLLIEHTLSPDPGLLQVQQRIFDPLQQLLAGGCHLTRDTRANLERAGWEQAQNVKRLEVFPAAGSAAAGPPGADVGVAGHELEGLQVGDLLQFKVPGLYVIGPHVAGVLSA